MQQGVKNCVKAAVTAASSLELQASRFVAHPHSLSSSTRTCSWPHPLPAPSLSEPTQAPAFERRGKKIITGMDCERSSDLRASSSCFPTSHPSPTQATHQQAGHLTWICAAPVVVSASAVKFS